MNKNTKDAVMKRVKSDVEWVISRTMKPKEVQDFMKKYFRSYYDAYGDTVEFYDAIILKSGAKIEI